VKGTNYEFYVLSICSPWHLIYVLACKPNVTSLLEFGSQLSDFADYSSCMYNELHWSCVIIIQVVLYFEDI
jgi:hypothetical protein